MIPDLPLNFLIQATMNMYVLLNNNFGKSPDKVQIVTCVFFHATSDVKDLKYNASKVDHSKVLLNFKRESTKSFRPVILDWDGGRGKT